MLIILSPAKSLVEGPAVPGLPATQPAMLDQTETLMKTTRRLSAPKLRKLMGISDKLAIRSQHPVFNCDAVRHSYADGLRNNHCLWIANGRCYIDVF